MANGEWLTQLMSGLGGAFTGETMARERIALEAEQERKRQEEQRRQEEAANERERLRQIQELRRQPFTKELGQQLLGLGDTPQSVAALQDIFVPKTPRKPLIEGVGKDNRRYTFDPNTGETTVSPFEEYRAPKSEGPTAAETRAETRAERRAAETAFSGATGDVRRMVRTQPKLADVKYQGISKSAARDTASFLEDRARFAADTAFGMEQARMAAQEPALGAQRQQEMSDLLATLSGRRPQMSPTAAAEQAEAREVQQAIARVMASNVSDAEKQAAVKAINDEFQKAILEIRSGR